LGLTVGFYFWVLGGPRPADRRVFQTTQTHLVDGLPFLVLVASVCGLALAAGLERSPRTRTWRARLSLASCGLYVSATVVAIGHAALLLAPACALAWLIGLVVRDEQPRGGALLFVLQTGSFGTALAFFHQWAWYRAGWEPFLQNLAALRKLWLGG
jgi:hypothetical protein